MLLVLGAMPAPQQYHLRVCPGACWGESTVKGIPVFQDKDSKGQKPTLTPGKRQGLGLTRSPQPSARGSRGQEAVGLQSNLSAASNRDSNNNDHMVIDLTVNKCESMYLKK